MDNKLWWVVHKDYANVKQIFLKNSFEPLKSLSPFYTSHCSFIWKLSYTFKSFFCRNFSHSQAKGWSDFFKLAKLSSFGTRQVLPKVTPTFSLSKKKKDPKMDFDMTLMHTPWYNIHNNHVRWAWFSFRLNLFSKWLKVFFGCLVTKLLFVLFEKFPDLLGSFM